MGIDDFIRGYKEGFKFGQECKPTVVRCVDCKHYNNKKHAQMCVKFSLFMKPMDFCSRGERRADAEVH